MYLLITRPYDDAIVLQNELSQASINTIIDPLFTPQLHYHKIVSIGQLIEQLNPQALVITSINALKVLQEIKNLTLPLLVVGSSTSAFANNNNISFVKKATHNASSLADWIIDNLKPKAGPLLYLRGEVVAFDFKTTLESKGFSLIEEIVYLTVPKQSFGDQSLVLLKQKKISAVLFYSKQTADIFITVAKKTKIIDYLKDIDALVLSSNIEESLQQVCWQNIYIAQNPDASSMKELVNHYVTKK